MAGVWEEGRGVDIDIGLVRAVGPAEALEEWGQEPKGPAQRPG